MSDRVDALEIGGQQLADIPIYRWDPAFLVSSKGAILVKLGINPNHIMTGRLKPVDEGAADIAPMPSYQDPHFLTPTFSREPYPGSIVRRATAFRAGYPYIARMNRGGRLQAAGWRQAVPWTLAPNSWCRLRCIRRRPAPEQKRHR